MKQATEKEIEELDRLRTAFEIAKLKFELSHCELRQKYNAPSWVSIGSDGKWYDNQTQQLYKADEEEE